ncbi:small RNA 2'-O-methyltransferase isoform X1 [Denticeps clupeoides]|uniref:small RNA 2'-O-methyltransferase isoform X1 n=1 Tax=Denticeps clupeoides TaxID=299321 RepID=UPI0010A45A72|nr:small RNA 2'-O-methyltransferase isoform X1 [Denticeps clupeoides]
MFSPPLYKQRYEFVVEFVKSNDVKSVLDVGCSNLSLLRRLRFLRHVVELLVGLDTDASAVRRSMFTLSPFPGDYLQPGERPLAVELYHGSVVERDPCTRGFDLVTCVELVEHLPLPDVDVFSAVLFGYMAPASVIVSTPNAEFNPLLPGVTAFRHTDHKFEWTRAQFQAWARDACRTFGYAVEFTGVGEAPPTHAHVGFCTQIGVFRRAEGRGAPADWRAREEPSAYKLVRDAVTPLQSPHLTHGDGSLSPAVPRGVPQPEGQQRHAAGAGERGAVRGGAGVEGAAGRGGARRRRALPAARLRVRAAAPHLVLSQDPVPVPDAAGAETRPAGRPEGHSDPGRPRRRPAGRPHLTGPPALCSFPDGSSSRLVPEFSLDCLCIWFGILRNTALTACVDACGSRNK